MPNMGRRAASGPLHRFGPGSKTARTKRLPSGRGSRPSSNQDYESPWLSGLVTFSGFVAAFIGSVAVIFLVVHLVHGTGWWPFALMLAGLVGAHLCLRAVRYQRRRHAGHSPR